MKVVHVSGKRKRAIARATVREGKGIVRVNTKLLSVFNPPLARMRIQEPLILAGDLANKVDIDVVVRGGGVISGADAVRLSIARGLVEFAGRGPLRQRFLDYDRNILVQDVRRNEPHKPGDSKPRPRSQKSYHRGSP